MDKIIQEIEEQILFYENSVKSVNNDDMLSDERKNICLAELQIEKNVNEHILKKLKGWQWRTGRN